jgi:hypothetical protein
LIGKKVENKNFLIEQETEAKVNSSKQKIKSPLDNFSFNEKLKTKINNKKIVIFAKTQQKQLRFCKK